MPAWSGRPPYRRSVHRGALECVATVAPIREVGVPPAAWTVAVYAHRGGVNPMIDSASGDAGSVTAGKRDALRACGALLRKQGWD